MTPADLSEALELRASTRENAITADELERDYGITAESVTRAMAVHVRGWLCHTREGPADDRMVGFAMGDAETGEVLVVAVHPDFEGRGVGTWILSAVRDWLFSLGHEQLWLGANPDPALRAGGLYRRLGWRPAGRMTGQDEVLVLDRPQPPAP